MLHLARLAQRIAVEVVDAHAERVLQIEPPATAVSASFAAQRRRTPPSWPRPL